MSKVLEPNETILWIKAARFSRQSKFVAILFGLIFLIFLTLFLTQIVYPFFQGEAPEYEGKPVTLNLIYILAAGLSILFIFLALAIRAQRAIRYIVTDRRAFIYVPSLNFSFYYDYKDKKWKRDYAATDDEGNNGPISQGGYFTERTQIEKTPSDPTTSLTINGLSHRKNPDQDHGELIKKIPILGMFPSVAQDVTIRFDELEDIETALQKISPIINKFKSQNG